MKPLSFKTSEVLGRGLDAWVRMMGTLAVFALVLITPVYVLWYTLDFESGFSVSIAITAAVFAQLVLNGLVARLVFDRLDGKHHSLADAAAQSLPRLPKILLIALVLTAVLSILAFFPVIIERYYDAPTNQRIGFTIVVGLILLCICTPIYMMLCMAPNAAVMQGGSPFKAFSVSRSLSKGELTTLATIHMMTLLTQAGIVGIALIPLQAMRDTVPKLTEPTTFLTVIGAMVLASTAAAAVAGATYHTRRLRDEGFGIAALERIFE